MSNAVRWMIVLSLLGSGCGSGQTPEMPSWIPEPSTFSGEVTERLAAGPYTYARIQGRWVVTLGAVEPGFADVRGFGKRINYRSRRLGRTFDTIVFGIIKKKEVSTHEQTALTPAPRRRRMWRLH